MISNSELTIFYVLSESEDSSGRWKEDRIEGDLGLEEELSV